jgi:hypothetical protein
MNVLEARESESLEELAADTSCPNHENFSALQNPKTFQKDTHAQPKFKIPLEFETFEWVGLGFWEKLILGIPKLVPLWQASVSG